MDERLVAIEDAVPARQQVALEPALAQMLGQHLDDAALRPRGARRSAGARRLPLPVGDGEDVAEPVRLGLVGAEHPEAVGVLLDDAREEAPEHPHRLARARRRTLDVDGEAPEVRQLEVAQQHAPVRVGIGAHPALADGREGAQLGDEPPVGVEQLLGPVAAQPLLELAAMVVVRARLGERHLV